MKYCIAALAGLAVSTLWPLESRSEQLLSPLELEQFVHQHAQPADQHDKLCGVYSLTYLLRLLGVQVTTEEVQAGVTVSEFGTSLGDLSAFARSHGQHLQVVRCPPSQIDQLHLPAIAHIEPSDHFPVAHYVVLLRVDPDVVVLFDWNTRSVDSYNRRDFVSRCSGYYLVTEVVDRTVYWLIALSVVNIVLLIVIAWCLRLSSLPRMFMWQVFSENRTCSQIFTRRIARHFWGKLQK